MSLLSRRRRWHRQVSAATPSAHHAVCCARLFLLQSGVPEGTPVVPVRDLPSRPRRNRKSETVRRAFSETFLHPGGWGQQ